MWDHLNDFPLGIISQILGARVHPETLLSGEYPDAMAVRMHFQMIFRLFFFLATSVCNFIQTNASLFMVLLQQF